MYFILPFAIWPVLYLASDYFVYGHEKMKIHLPFRLRNFLGFVDASSCCIGALGYYINDNINWYNYSLIIPISYYIWDSYLIICKNMHKEFAYVYHHIIAILLLNELYDTDELFKSQLYPVLVAAELCNLPLYYSYFVIKTNPVNDDMSKEDKYKNLTKHSSAKLFQIIVFILLRVIYFSYHISNVYTSIERSEPFAILLSAYFIILLTINLMVTFKDRKNYLALKTEWTDKNDLTLIMFQVRINFHYIHFNTNLNPQNFQ